MTSKGWIIAGTAVAGLAGALLLWTSVRGTGRQEVVPAPPPLEEEWVEELLPASACRPGDFHAWNAPECAPEADLWLEAVRSGSFEQMASPQRAVGREAQPFAAVRVVVEGSGGLEPGLTDHLRMWIVSPSLGRAWTTRRALDGSFTADRIPEGGPLFAVVDVPGYSTHLRAFWPPQQAKVYLRRDESRKGRVLHDGAPVRGATVWMADGPVRTVTSGADGSFELTVPPDQDAVRAIKGELVGAAEYRLSDSVDIHLSPSARLQLEVRDDSTGALIPGARASMRPAIRSRLPEAFFQEAGPGKHVAAGIESGSYRVSISAPGYFDVQDKEIEVRPPSTSVTLSLVPGQAVRGRVLNADTGEPIANARVVLEDGEGNRSAVHVTDSGRFSITGVRGRQLIKATSTGFLSGEWKLDLPHQGPVALKLERGPGVLVQVLEPDGRAAPDARLVVSRVLEMERTELHDYFHWDLDARGRMDLRPMEPGRYEVFAVATGFVRSDPASFTVSGVHELTLELKPGMHISGSVVTPAGEPAAGVNLRIGHVYVVTGTDGSFLATGLDDRNYMISRVEDVTHTPLIRPSAPIPAGTSGVVLTLR